MIHKQTGSTEEGIGVGPRRKTSDILAETTSIRRVLQSAGFYPDSYITSGVLTDRPEAAIKNRFYVDTDSKKIYFDNGSEWVDLTIVVALQDHTHELVQSTTGTALTIIKPLLGWLYTGTLTSGTFNSLTTMFDGDIMHITEVVGVPGYDLRVNFYDVSTIDSVVVRAYYNGATTHSCRIQLYNFNTLAWDVIHTMTTSTDYQQHYKTVPGSGADYISAGIAIMALYHTESGTASHDLYIDALQLGYY